MTDSGTAYMGMNASLASSELAKAGLRYVPPPLVSGEFQRAFEGLVPVDLATGRRLLRFVWGMDRLEYYSGEYLPRYADTENDPPKYIGKARWIIEGWQSPDVYDRAEWASYAHLLGPFPEDGVWDFIEVHETPDGEFAPLDSSALRKVEGWAWHQKQSRRHVVGALLQAKARRQELREATRKAAADAVMDEYHDLIARAFVDGDKNAAFSIPSGMKMSAGGILVKA